jgi:hypothetical protein
MAWQQALKRGMALATGLLLVGSVLGCDELSRAKRRDDPASALNTRTSKWRGNSSDGSYSHVEQVSTGKNSFVFSETWYKKGPKPIKTSGSGRYEESTLQGGRADQLHGAGIGAAVLLEIPAEMVGNICITQLRPWKTRPSLNIKAGQRKREAL